MLHRLLRLTLGLGAVSRGAAAGAAAAATERMDVSNADGGGEDEGLAVAAESVVLKVAAASVTVPAATAPHAPAHATVGPIVADVMAAGDADGCDDVTADAHAAAVLAVLLAHFPPEEAADSK